MAHTQGPWTASGVGIANIGFGSDPLTRNVWVSGTHFIGDEMGPAVDDARLIAAAPELLEAISWLVAMESRHERGINWKTGIAQARAAIAKATGSR